MQRNDLVEALRDLDICFMTTAGEGGTPHSRPMSNNGEVEWDGTNWFFSHADTNKVRDIKNNPSVTLSFEGEGLWIVLYGKAELHVDDKALFQKYWQPDLDRWFEEGIDTPGLTLIEVKADMAESWGSAGDGRIEL